MGMRLASGRRRPQADRSHQRCHEIPSFICRPGQLQRCGDDCFALEAQALQACKVAVQEQVAGVGLVRREAGNQTEMLKKVSKANSVRCS